MHGDGCALGTSQAHGTLLLASMGETSAETMVMSGQRGGGGENAANTSWTTSRENRGSGTASAQEGPQGAPPPQEKRGVHLTLFVIRTPEKDLSRRIVHSLIFPEQQCKTCVTPLLKLGEGGGLFGGGGNH